MYTMVLIATLTTTSEAPAFFFGGRAAQGTFGHCPPPAYGWCNHGGYPTVWHGYYPRTHGACFGCNGCAGSLWGPQLHHHHHHPMVHQIPQMPRANDVPDKEKSPVKPATDARPKGDNFQRIIPRLEAKEARTSIKSSSTARIVALLPANADFYMDGQKMKSQGSRRVFRTPDLEQGQIYEYELRAVLHLNGKRQTIQRRVLIRAGDDLQVSFRSLKGEGGELIVSR